MQSFKLILIFGLVGSFHVIWTSVLSRHAMYGEEEDLKWKFAFQGAINRERLPVLYLRCNLKDLVFIQSNDSQRLFGSISRFAIRDALDVWLDFTKGNESEEAGDVLLMQHFDLLINLDEGLYSDIDDVIELSSECSHFHAQLESRNSEFEFSSQSESTTVNVYIVNVWPTVELAEKITFLLSSILEEHSAQTNVPLKLENLKEKEVEYVRAIKLKR